MLKNTKEIIKKNFFFRLFPWDYSHPAGSDLYTTCKRKMMDSSSDADQEYIYFMGPETSPSLRCKPNLSI